jgi:hypothetical protein
MSSESGSGRGLSDLIFADAGLRLFSRTTSNVGGCAVLTSPTPKTQSPAASGGQALPGSFALARERAPSVQKKLIDSVRAEVAYLAHLMPGVYAFGSSRSFGGSC